MSDSQASHLTTRHKNGLSKIEVEAGTVIGWWASVCDFQSPGLFRHLFSWAGGFFRRASWGVLPGVRTSGWPHSSTHVEEAGKLDGFSESTPLSESCVWVHPPSPYPLQGANLQTLPGPWRVAQSSVAGRLRGHARLEGLNGSPCKLSKHAASGCTHFPHCQGHLIPSPFCILILPAFHYMNQSCFLAGSTTLSETSAFSALQLPFVRLITSIQSAVTDISVSLWVMPSVCFLGRKQR